jgi:hypothetical protein
MSAIGNQAAANPMQALLVLLFNEVLRHEPHGRLRHGFADSFGIVGVVLLRLHIPLDELGRPQPNRMFQTTKHARPVVRAAAGLGPYQVWRLLREESSHMAPSQLPSRYRTSCLVSSVQIKDLLAISSPIVVAFIIVRPSS